MAHVKCQVKQEKKPPAYDTIHSAHDAKGCLPRLDILLSACARGVSIYLTGKKTTVNKWMLEEENKEL